MLQENIKQLFFRVMENHGNGNCTIEKVSPIGGGDINQSVMIKTGDGEYFMKWNRAGAYPAIFEKEARGLKLLSETGEIKVPYVIGYDEDDSNTILVLEYIKSPGRKKDFWEDFGKSLARMHNHYGEGFGLDHDNYIGNLKQSNKRHDDWISFFVEERLERQIDLALQNNRIDNSTIKKFNSLYHHLEDFFPVEEPSLLHGDLWSGNYIASSQGSACIIDPAVYYGHRLMDLGMSKLFGGFDSTFYKAYQEVHPLESNWKEAVEICNLYPLMVHVNLFGGGYLNSVRSILRSF